MKKCIAFVRSAAILLSTLLLLSLLTSCIAILPSGTEMPTGNTVTPAQSSSIVPPSTETPVPTVTPHVMPEGLEDCYGRNVIASMPNGEKLCYVYDTIYTAANEMTEDVKLDHVHYPVTVEELSMAADACFNDHAELFWVDLGRYGYSKSSDGIVRSVTLRYLMTGKELTAAKKIYDDAIDFYFADMPEGLDEYGKELYLHDLLVSRVSYGESAHAHSAYGVFNGETVVCEGYARALQCLLSRAGIQSYIVTGIGRAENHRRNLVRIDGKYAYVDATWDDADDAQITHGYFNITTSELLLDHTIGGDNLALPSCDSPEINYHVRNGNIFTSPFTVEAIVSRIGEDYVLVAFLESESAAEEYVNFLQEHFSEIVEAVGIDTGCSGSFNIVGREVRFVLIPS